MGQKEGKEGGGIGAEGQRVKGEGEKEMRPEKPLNIKSISRKTEQESKRWESEMQRERDLKERHRETEKDKEGILRWLRY